jgi:hypothetical protein
MCWAQFNAIRKAFANAGFAALSLANCAARRQAPVPAPRPLRVAKSDAGSACISRENTGWRVSPDAAFLDSRSTRLLQMQRDLQQTADASDRAGCTLFVLPNADVKPSANAGFARLDAPGRGTAGGRISAESDHSGRVAGRVGSACDRSSTPSGPKRWAKPPKSLFMSNVAPGTRFDARPRVWPGLLSPVTSTDSP